MNTKELANEIFQEVMSQQKGQRGKKRCPACSALVGVRTYKCECGHQFVNKKTKVEQRHEFDEATEEERLYALCIRAPGGLLVYAPSGSPSAELTEFTYEAVSDYCDLVVHEGIEKGCIYTVQAIKKYLQHQLGYNSEEYWQACSLVDEWYYNKLGIDIPSGDEHNG